MNIFTVFPTAFCLFLLVKSEEYITAKVKKRYTIVSSPYYYLPITRKTIYSINTRLKKNVFGIRGTTIEIVIANSNTVFVQKYVLNDTIVMETGMICAYQSGACDDLNNYSRFEWTNKTMMSAPENTACLQNMMDFPLFRGMVEEWTVSYNPLVKFLILDVNNTKRVLNLVNMKNICDSWLWTTDQDNVFVFESEDSLPNITSNFSFAKDFKILENTSQFSQEKLSTKCDDGFESNLLINNTLNTISSCIHIILYLILYLIIFLTFRFVVGIITNFILLARINRTNLMELLVLSCSQNLTNQKIFFKEPESVKNLYAIAKSYEAVYESAENQYYRK